MGVDFWKEPFSGSDNEYHMAFKSGLKQATHKYSEKLVDLLKVLQQEQAQKAVSVSTDPTDPAVFP
jgi:hypothetical protein